MNNANNNLYQPRRYNMSNNRLCKNQYGHESSNMKNRQKRRPTSFWVQDPELVFGELKLKEGYYFLDIGCGTGDYSIHASKIVGDSGVVYALDIQKELINNLREKAYSEGFKNIKAIVSDMTCPLPIEDNSIDVCFISTVLHSIDLTKHGEMLFGEIHRVLKLDGRLVIIECKKEDLSRGPPMHMRISPEELENCVTSYGFRKLNLVDLGFNYMIQFGVKN